MSVTAPVPSHIRNRAARAHERLSASLAPERVSLPEQYGPNGWLLLLSWPRGRRVRPSGKIIVNLFSLGDTGWIHASMSREDRVPTYEELVALHDAVFGDGWAYQVFAPPADHVNIHPFALHLWGRADGEKVLPNFGAFGTI